jgi:hypothetical protein
MLAYHYPPVVASGCARIKRFVDNLPLFGYDPLVVTVANGQQPADAREEKVFRARRIVYDRVALPDVVVRKVFKFFGIQAGFEFFDRVFLFPDDACGFVPAAVGRGMEIYGKHPYDLIYVTCKPFSTAIAAVALKKKLKLPLVVDLRDPYAYDFHEKVPGYYSFMRKKMEQYVLANTDCLVINTDGGKALYEQHYPHLAIRTIHNGFDNRSESSLPGNGSMIISHVGHLYGLKRNPQRLFSAMSRLKDCNMVFRSIGDTYKGIMAMAREYGIEDKIQVFGSVDHQTALSHIAGSDVLFLTQLPYYDRHYSISIANKTFEYLETGKPILADVPEGDNAALLQHYSRNSHVITDKDPDKIHLALKDLYGKWRSGNLKPQVNPEFIERFNGHTLTGKLADVFDSVLGVGRSSLPEDLRKADATCR